MTTNSNPIDDGFIGSIPIPTAEAVQRFPLGRTCATPAALRAIRPDAMLGAVQAHACGYWGDVGDEDAEENERALFGGERIFSVFHDGPVKFWIITEADRSVTTVLLPEDY